jgi:hypothetical protein
MRATGTDGQSVHPDQTERVPPVAPRSAEIGAVRLASDAIRIAPNCTDNGDEQHAHDETKDAQTLVENVGLGALPQRNASNCIEKCERGDSNPHAFRHWILSPARLPIPPLSPALHRRCNRMAPQGLRRRPLRADAEPALYRKGGRVANVLTKFLPKGRGVGFGGSSVRFLTRIRGSEVRVPLLGWVSGASESGSVWSSGESGYWPVEALAKVDGGLVQRLFGRCGPEIELVSSRPALEAAIGVFAEICRERPASRRPRRHGWDRPLALGRPRFRQRQTPVTPEPPQGSPEHAPLGSPRLTRSAPAFQRRGTRNVEFDPRKIRPGLAWKPLPIRILRVHRM